MALTTSPARLEAQTVQAPTQTAQSAVKSLLNKAHDFEVRGRLDLAVQTWQEVLLSDPKNTEALGGLARAAKIDGNLTLANTYLDRLRAISPNDPNIARVESLGLRTDQKTELQEAAKLADAGKYSEAMATYRKVFGSQPPPAEWAVAYYETEAAIDASRPRAVSGLRALVDKDPGNAQYRIALGRVLTYDPATREEGREYLQSYLKEPKATEAFRQSLMWDAANPVTAPVVRAYLAIHNDPQMAAVLQMTESKANPATTAGASGPPAAAGSSSRAAPPSANGPAARGKAAAEMAAYQALNANHIDDAETRFKAILADDPESARALAGMGYVRMQQGNFAGAIGFLEQAKQHSSTDKGLVAALDTARFWFIMGEGQTALNSNDLTTAEKRYRAALELRPESPEGLEGLGGTLVKAQQPVPAIALFEHAVTVAPASSDGWRGLFVAQYQSGNAALALATERHIPVAVHAELMKDPLFLQTLAGALAAVGRGGDAQNVLDGAMKLPVTSEAKGTKADMQMQSAGLLVTANHLDQAEKLYADVVAGDPANSAAWQGLVRVEHAQAHDEAALNTIERMPPASYAASMRDPSFVLTVASVNQAQGKLDVAEDLLQKAVNLQTSAGGKASVALEMQLADVYVNRGKPQLAYPVYQQVITENPDRADAWTALLLALHVTGHDKEAVAQLKLLPVPVRARLETNPAYLQTMASVYAALGRSREATMFLGRFEQGYAAQRIAPPADVEIQNAWLLFNGLQDPGLYRQLMDIGGRTDLTEAQRKAVQTIWTNWAVRRANQASAIGNTPRALAILNAAARAFPDNPTAIKALAIGYAQAGQPHQTVQIYKVQNMASASAADYETAVSAALASDDMKDGEAWVRYALKAYPADPQILILGAKFEQARGNTAQAIKYYRASLKAMPPLTPGSGLGAELGLPAPAALLSLPGPDQPQDLSILLAPDASDEPATGGSPGAPGQPYLPGYGNQTPLPPYNGTSKLVPPYMTNPAGTGAQAKALNSHDATGTASMQRQAEVASAVKSATEAAMPSPPPGGAGEEVYRPFVAYIAPPPATPPVANEDHRSPPTAAVPVQLGDNAPQPVQPQSEMTDVLPTARYAPSARANEAARAGPEVAAARAARIRRLQEESAAASSGQSHPPPEGAITATTENAQYTTQPQVPQPTAPAGQFGNIPDTGAQQFPQPHTPPASGGPGTITRKPVARTPAAGPAPTASISAVEPVEPVVPAAAPTQPSATNPAATSPGLGQPYPMTAAPYPLAPPPTDAELRARNLPALGGSFASQAPLPQRQQAESELADLEGSYSGWLGATGVGRYRAGTSGLDRLYDVEAPVEASAVIGRAVRLTAVALPVFLNSGVLNTASFHTNYVPYLGTLPANAASAPAQQFSNGIGGELQLTAKNIGLAVGYTPYEFLVHNVTGRVLWNTLGGHLLLFGERESVKDTQLSYAGLRNPGVPSLGPIWGGVVSTTGGVRIEFGSRAAHFYVSGHSGILTGQHVPDNYKYEGTVGASFRAKNWPGFGSLTFGGELSGMHYDRNEVGLSYGQGGYFSPGFYFLASVPVTFNGRYKSNFHYAISGALGVQTFEQEVAPFYPLDPALQASFVPSNGVPCTATQAPSYNCGEYPLTDTAQFNYSVDAEASYRFAEHWYGGGFVSSNNTSNYNAVSAGFFFRYVFSAQHSADGYPPGLFRLDGLRPLQIP
jgi:tetratricopeptide (TPR) repeat protein